MPNQPLNPDALEAVASEGYEARRPFEDLPKWEDLLERNRKAEIRALGNIVSAYLTVAQPVDPDALEAGAKALFLRERKYHTPTKEFPEPPNWEDLTETSMEHYRATARAVLTVAQPVVNSVEELEALPPCSVIVDKHGDAGLIEYGHVKFAETAKLPMNYVAKRYLPARVLYRPEVNNA